MARAASQLSSEALDTLLARLDAGDTGGDVLKPLTKHFLGVLAQKAPGASVEVRIPPYAAIQCIEGTGHTRGTPSAVVETDALTWLSLARGETAWADAVVAASGERSDLSAWLPLI